MGVPRKVKIGGRVIKVKPVKDLEEASDRSGSADEDTIYLDPKVRSAHTLLHELLHHVSWWRGEKWTEQEIELGEAIVSMLIKDNPGTFRWLVDEIAGPERKTKKRKPPRHK